MSDDDERAIDTWLNTRALWIDRTNRQVALKVITPQIGDDEGFRARFTHEAQAQAS